MEIVDIHIIDSIGMIRCTGYINSQSVAGRRWSPCTGERKPGVVIDVIRLGNFGRNQVCSCERRMVQIEDAILLIVIYGVHIWENID